MRLFGLIGKPLGHSYSSVFFNKKFTDEGIEASYRNFELASIEQVLPIVVDNPFLVGFNVTSPYKRQILPYLDSLTPDAAEAGAVNTVRVERCRDVRRGFLLHGHNTDIGGFRRSVEPYLGTHRGKALILGSGGASSAALISLRSLGFDCKVVSRNAGVSDATYEELSPEIISEADIIVNATPLGMHPMEDKSAPIDYGVIRPDTLCVDMVYNPSFTLFMRKCSESGAAVKNGYGMLINQALLSWDFWNK